jgi:hypothetical protein
MNQLHIDDSYSRQAQINWPVLSARRECCLEGQACPVAVHDERQEAYANRHTPWDLYHFLDVHGTENSEEGRSGKHNGMAVPRVRNAFCPSGTLPLGWPLSAELAGVEERGIRGY